MLRRFLLASLATSCAFGAAFVGNQACSPCHGAIVRAYSKTPMARSSGKVGVADREESFATSEFRDAHGVFSYKVRPDYQFEFRQLGPIKPGVQQRVSGRRALAYFIGSGTAARTFLLASNGFLFESPVTYYRSSESWKASPGFASLDYPNLTRPITAGCLQCHASGVQPKAGTLNGYEATPFLGNGVACERCHGAGSDHVTFFSAAQQTSPVRPGTTRMVNPAKLAPAERDSICAQCHLSGEARIPKAGKKEGQVLTPGELLSDILTVFVRRGSPSDLRVTSHVENLEQSACKRASGDKLWCATCHDPHSTPEPAAKVAYFRGKCLACHGNQSCRAAQSARRAKGHDCTACHMPRGPASDIEHVVFTDHSIRRSPFGAATSESTAPAVAGSPSELVPYYSYTASTRDMAVANAVVGLRDHNNTDRQRAFGLLKQSVEQGTADPLALVYLAEFYRDSGDDTHAIPLYEEVWRRDRTQYAAAAALGAYQMQRGNLVESIEFWKQALASNPAMTLVRVNMATALLRMGKTAEAKAAVEKALELNPASLEARELLARISASAK